MAVGQSIPRVDAYEKVTGGAKYTDDMRPANCLVAKIVRSTIANGKVLAIDITKAMEVPGVVKVVTCFDVPQHAHATAGHPWSTDPHHQDVADRKLLAEQIHIYGDDVAVVIAEDDVSAARGVSLVKVDYEEYPVVLDAKKAMAADAPVIHPEIRKTNVLAHSTFAVGEGKYEDYTSEADTVSLESNFKTQIRCVLCLYGKR